MQAAHLNIFLGIQHAPTSLYKFCTILEELSNQAEFVIRLFSL